MANKLTKEIIGESLIELQVTDSTNNYAMQAVKRGAAKHGNAFFAYEQTTGKGQRSKKWYSEPGANVIVSVVLETEWLQLENLFEISVICAVAAHDTFSFYTKQNVSIKWPNDIFWCDRKAGGILVENNFRGDKWQFSIAGFGININQTVFEPHLANAVSLIQITGRTFNVLEITKQLLKNLNNRYDELQNKGFNALLHQYNNVLYKRGETVKLKRDNIIFECIIKEVNRYGELLTENAGKFRFGEVEWIIT